VQRNHERVFERKELLLGTIHQLLAMRPLDSLDLLVVRESGVDLVPQFSLMSKRGVKPEREVAGWRARKENSR